jgi:tetratricopeptide (TPR) repeat protein
MQAFARRAECKHIVWAGPLVNTAATLKLGDELRGRTCPTCGELVGKVDFVVVQDPTSSFDEPPAPRNNQNKLRKASVADARKTRKHLGALGARTDGLAADLRETALELTPSPWRATLAMIPVGLLPTYEPNAECIRFRDSPVPAIVFHQGLAGYLFKMNRSLFPLLRMASLTGSPIGLADDKKTRAALRVQAVDTALEFLGVGRPRSKTLVEIPMIAKVMEMPLTRIMSSFVLCHEYGHAVLNHVDELRAVGPGSRFSVLERSRAMEHEADAWGQDAVTGAYTGGKQLEQSLDVLDQLFSSDGADLLKQDISHAAPCVALLYFEFLDTIEERLTRHGVEVGGPSESHGLLRRRARDAGTQSTHPSNEDRFRALYAHLSKHSNFTAHTWVEAFEGLLGDVKDDLDRLIDQTGAVPGRRLSPRFWRRAKAKAKAKTGPRPDSWRDTITMIDEDDDTRLRLQEALQSLEAKGQGPYRSLDPAEVRRHDDQLRERAHAHYDKKEYAKAEPLLKQILERGDTAEWAGLYPLLGDCREKLGDQTGAITAYAKCLELAPGSHPAAMAGFFLGRILLFEKGDPGGAEKALTVAAASEIPAVKGRARFWLGTIAHGRDDVEGALKAYREVYALRGTKLAPVRSVIGMAALNIGGVFEERGQFAEAAKMFTVAIGDLADSPAERAVAEQHLRAVRGR